MINDINCNIKPDDIIKKINRVLVGTIYLNNKKYIIKKDNENSEYNFYKKYSKKIVSDKMNKNINIPLKMLDCKQNKMFIFNWIDTDYNGEYIYKISYDQWLDYTIQLCLTIYYVNHILKIFHNDLNLNNNLRNIMIKKNNIQFTITVDKIIYEIKENYIVLIDFGHQHHTIKKQTDLHGTNYFYNSEYIKKLGYKFKYYSEVFIVFYISYKFFYKINDKWNEKYNKIYDKMYNDFIEESDSNVGLKNFDLYIINSLLKLKK